MIRRPQRSTLFPSTTLFRSIVEIGAHLIAAFPFFRRDRAAVSETVKQIESIEGTRGVGRQDQESTKQKRKRCRERKQSEFATTYGSSCVHRAQGDSHDSMARRWRWAGGVWLSGLDGRGGFPFDPRAWPMVP